MPKGIYVVGEKLRAGETVLEHCYRSRVKPGAEQDVPFSGSWLQGKVEVEVK